MHIDRIPNRNSRPAYLLRESVRDGKPGTQLVLRSTDPQRLAEAESELKIQLAMRGWI